MATQRKRRRTFRDDHAAALIEELCTARGWSSYDLADACERVAQERNDPRFAVSRRTIDRIVADGVVPQARVKAGIALALGVAPWQLWGAGAMPLGHQVPVRMQVAA